MKNQEEIKIEIKQYIVESSMTNIEDLKDDTLIFDAGLLDSMGLLFLIEFLNENYQIEVSDEELNPKNFESISNIVSFVNEKLSVSK